MQKSSLCWEIFLINPLSKYAVISLHPLIISMKVILSINLSVDLSRKDRWCGMLLIMSYFPPSPFFFHPIMMITNKSSSWFHLSKDFSQNCAGSFRCCGHGRGSETERKTKRERGTEIELDIHKQTSSTTRWGHWEGHTEVRLRQTRKRMKLNKNQKTRDTSNKTQRLSKLNIKISIFPKKEQQA